MTDIPTIHLWEFAPSPHLGNVLAGMASRGFPARYVVHSEAYENRKSEGWIRPEFRGVEIVLARGPDEILSLIAHSQSDDIHICVGLRGNEYVRDVAASLRKAGRRFWVFMEAVNERRWWSALKRPLYHWLFARNRPWLEGILAAGAATPKWVVSRGVPEERVFDFAYFLNANQRAPSPTRRSDSNFRLLYAGKLIPRKRVHLIIEGLKELPAHVTLEIVGDGPSREQIEAQAKVNAPGRVTFYGTRPMPEVSNLMASADCLVLPSDHDGWGAVISEALLVGTRVVCSDRCGASIVVAASGAGHVFDTFTDGACTTALQGEVKRGPANTADRGQLADWALCLTETAGAAYLEALIAHVRKGAPRPPPPWNAPVCSMHATLN
ncbi:MAG: glycosyltransferase [Martelella sp.]|uniref:glycosyltransferase n=1 Tax=Martelella sp. TaxID=1969699 RepID=UPI003242EEDE